MSIEQPEEALSSNNLGTEIWETNSSGNRHIHLSANALFSVLLLLSILQMVLGFLVGKIVNK